MGNPSPASSMGSSTADVTTKWLVQQDEAERDPHQEDSGFFAGIVLTDNLDELASIQPKVKSEHVKQQHRLAQRFRKVLEGKKEQLEVMGGNVLEAVQNETQNFAFDSTIQAVFDTTSPSHKRIQCVVGFSGGHGEEQMQIFMEGLSTLPCDTADIGRWSLQRGRAVEIH